MPQRTSLLESCFDLLIPDGVTMGSQRIAGRVDPLDSTAHNPSLWMSIHKGDLRLQTVFTSYIVGVHPRNVPALSERAALIQGIDQPTVLLTVDLHTGVIG